MGKRRKNRRAQQTVQQFDQQSERKTQQFEQTAFNEPQVTSPANDAFYSSIYEKAISKPPVGFGRYGANITRSMGRKNDLFVSIQEKNRTVYLSFKNDCLGNPLPKELLFYIHDDVLMFTSSDTKDERLKSSKKYAYKVHEPSKSNGAPHCQFVPPDYAEWRSFTGEFARVYPFPVSERHGATFTGYVKASERIAPKGEE